MRKRLQLLGGNDRNKTCIIYTPEDEELEYEVEYEAEPYVPARIYGEPDDCYPEEGGEIDLISVKLNGLEVMGTLDEDVLDEIERQCWEDCDE